MQACSCLLWDMPFYEMKSSVKVIYRIYFTSSSCNLQLLTD